MNILVLDDEREIADLLEVYLKNENYNVFKFYDHSVFVGRNHVDSIVWWILETLFDVFA